MHCALICLKFQRSCDIKEQRGCARVHVISHGLRQHVHVTTSKKWVLDFLSCKQQNVRINNAIVHFYPSTGLCAQLPASSITHWLYAAKGRWATKPGCNLTVPLHIHLYKPFTTLTFAWPLWLRVYVCYAFRPKKKQER